MIFHEIKQKPVEFTILISAFVLSLVLFFVFNSNLVVKKIITISIASFYFFWSIFYHYKRGDLHISIVIEYLIFALFAAIVVFSVLI